MFGIQVVEECLLQVPGHGFPGEAVGVARQGARRGDRAGAGAGQQREELDAQRAAGQRRARAARAAHRGAAAGPLH